MSITSIFSLLNSQDNAHELGKRRRLNPKNEENSPIHSPILLMKILVQGASLGEPLTTPFVLTLIQPAKESP